MLKRTTQTIRAVAESAGLIVPTPADAQTAAESRRQALVAAQAAIAKAEETLMRLHDEGADEKKITAAEAVLADAKLTAERAQRAYASAEKRLAIVRMAEADKAQAVAKYKLDEALQIRTEAAGSIDKLAVELGKLVGILEAQDIVLIEAMRDHAAENFRPALGRGKRICELALSKTGCIPRAYMGDVTQHPDAAYLIALDNGALKPVTTTGQAE